MRCPICKDEGREHRLTEQRVPRPLHLEARIDKFYDENDKLHIHDDEVRTFAYSCSNGHHFRVDMMSRCTVRECEWNERPAVKNGQKSLEEIYREGK